MRSGGAMALASGTFRTPNEDRAKAAPGADKREQKHRRRGAAVHRLDDVRPHQF